MRSFEDEFSSCEFVAGDYFGTLAIPPLAGRVIDRRDTATGERVAVVNESFARAHWASPLQALGHRLFFGNDSFIVVGVVHDIRYVREGPLPLVYFPHEQFPRASPQMTLFVRAPRRVNVVREALARLVRTMDPDQPIYNVLPLDRIVFESLARLRAVTALVIVFGMATVLVAAIGVYGALAHAVARRRREMAIRLAVGETSGALFTSIVADGLKMVVGGVLVGIPLAIGLARLVQSEIEGIGHDVPAYVAALLLTCVVGVLGSLVPAYRAMRTDPMSLLRSE